MSFTRKCTVFIGMNQILGLKFVLFVRYSSYKLEYCELSLLKYT